MWVKFMESIENKKTSPKRKGLLINTAATGFYPDYFGTPAFLCSIPPEARP